MAWVDIDPVHTIDLSDASLMTDIVNNLVYLYGQQVGQTEIVVEDIVNISSMTAESGIHLVKRYAHADAMAAFEFYGQDTDEGAATLDDQAQCSLRFDVTNDTTGAEGYANMGSWPYQGLVFSGGTGSVTPPYTSAMLSILNTNQVIIGKRFGGDATPTYDVTVNGDVNVTGSYYLDNSALVDWTETPGSPDRLDWTGNANVTRWAAGSLAVTSTTMVEGLAAGLLNGHAWHTPLFKSRVGGENCTASYVESGVTSVFAAWNAGVTLDKAGKWLILWCGNFANGASADLGDLATLQLNVQTGGATIGGSVDVSCLGGYVTNTQTGTTALIGAVPLMLMGAYTSASGGEVIGVKAKITGYSGGGAGTVNNYWDGCMCAVWIGP